MTVGKILTNLEENDIKYNPLKYDWVVQKTDFLGHWMTLTHIKPMKKKIKTILRMVDWILQIKCALLSAWSTFIKFIPRTCTLISTFNRND